MAKLDPKDPRNLPGSAMEVSDNDVEAGVYVFQPKDEAEQPIGEKKYLESRDPVHAEAFISAGWRRATEAEAKEYHARTEKAQKENRNELLDDEVKRREEFAGRTGQSMSEPQNQHKTEQTEAKVKENK